MKKLTFFMAMLMGGSCATAQSNNSIVNTDLNLGFEVLNYQRPVGWLAAPSDQYDISIDSIVKHSGKFAVKIKSIGDKPQRVALVLRLPDNYEGKRIMLSGYIKTEGIEGGNASLMISIPNVDFAKTDAQKINGTSDWKAYKVAAKLNPERSGGIIIGGMLSGIGTMWLDDLQIRIDDRPLKDAKLWVAPAGMKDTAYAQGSGITTLGKDSQTIKNLKVLGLVWGYLKFYHPNIVAGNYNWDNELFRRLSVIAAAKTDGERDRMLSDWIGALGGYPQNADSLVLAKGLEIKMDVDTSWFCGWGLSAALVRELRSLYTAARSTDNYYVDFGQADNVVFRHERSYGNMRKGDVGLRILSLYRFWNNIQYYYPYRYLLGDWEQVLSDYLPKMIEADSRAKYELSVMELVAKLQDSHSVIFGRRPALDAYFGHFCPPFGVTYIQNKWVVTRFLDSAKAAASGIKIGDVLIKIDEKKVEDIASNLIALTPASNQAALYNKMKSNLVHVHDSSMRLTFRRANRKMTKIVKTYKVDALPSLSNADSARQGFKMLNNNIAYLYLGKITQADLPEIFEKARDTKAMIIDLRCYPQFLVAPLCKYLSRRPQYYVRGSSVDGGHPGRFLLYPAATIGSHNAAFYKGKVVVLVNAYTQSRAEFTAMAIQAATDATIIGSTTSGADGTVSNMVLPGGLMARFTGQGIYYPNAAETQQVGIKPDIIAKPTIDGIRTGRDEVIEQAVDFIEKGK